MCRPSQPTTSTGSEGRRGWRRREKPSRSCHRRRKETCAASSGRSGRPSPAAPSRISTTKRPRLRGPEAMKGRSDPMSPGAGTRIVDAVASTDADSSLRPEASRTPIIPLHRGAELFPGVHRGGLPFGLRELLHVGDNRPAPPSELEPGPAVRERREDVVGRDVAAVADAVHMPPVRRMQRDDLPGPIPPGVGILEILEGDGTRAALDDLPLVRLPFQTRILGSVIGAPRERKVERDAERDADAIFGYTGPVPSDFFCHHFAAWQPRHARSALGRDKSCRVFAPSARLDRWNSLRLRGFLIRLSEKGGDELASRTHGFPAAAAAWKFLTI